MSIRFPFARRLIVGDIEVRRPIIRVSLHSKGFRWTVDAKLDTGADYCLFDAEVAEQLDLILDQGRKAVFSSAGVTWEGYIHTVDLTLGAGAEEETVRCRAVFREQVRENLLGHLDFFEAFRVTLSAHEDYILLERVYRAPDEEGEGPGDERQGSPRG